MKTKNRILQAALELFNKKGINEVTLRGIAIDVGMSQGNLNYHFRTKSEIVAELYYNLVGEMDEAMKKITQDQPVFSLMFESSLVSMNILYKYKFIAQDLYSVLDSNSELKAHYLALQKMRKQQFLFLFQNMIEDGLMRKEELKDEYERLYERMNILGDNWINTANLFFKENSSKVAHYHSLLFEVIFPYLTQIGKEQYLKSL